MITIMNYGKAFKEIREEQGLSRNEVAKKICCTPSALCKIENNKTNPKQATVNIFCFVTRTPLARLYSLAFEPRDYAPYASVKDVCVALRESGVFSDEEIDDIKTRLKKDLFE